jgi:Sigma-70, region 4
VEHVLLLKDRPCSAVTCPRRDSKTPCARSLRQGWKPDGPRSVKSGELDSHFPSGWFVRAGQLTDGLSTNGRSHLGVICLTVSEWPRAIRSERERRRLSSCRGSGMTHAAIAKELDISRELVKQILDRVRREERRRGELVESYQRKAQCLTRRGQTPAAAGAHLRGCLCFTRPPLPV